jgi:hypothetical protein
MLPGRFAVVLAACVASAACGDDSHGPKDAPVDQPLNDGVCPNGAEVFFTGEFIDWDATVTAFCGIFDATWQVHGDATRTDKTNPNGRFELCIDAAATTQIDITLSTMTSQCTTGAPYALPGIAIANQAVIATGKLFSARSLTMGRLAPFFTSVGVTLDPAKAIVFVHVEGTPRAVSIAAAHGTALAFDGATWAAGATGQNVVFPNTDLGGGSTTVDVAGGAIGTGSIPLAANTFTYLTVVAN